MNSFWGYHTMLHYKRLTVNAGLLQKQGDEAGFKISAAYNTKVPARSNSLVYTDLVIKIPKNTCGHLSSLYWPALDRHLEVSNQSFDNNSNSDLRVIVHNHSDVDYLIQKGEYFALLTILKIENTIACEHTGLVNFLELKDSEGSVTSAKFFPSSKSK